jgi:hypothetical protein
MILKTTGRYIEYIGTLGSDIYELVAIWSNSSLENSLTETLIYGWEI